MNTFKAIRTRYAGPTETKGSRIIADDGDGNRITISMDCARSSEDAHREAAHALADKMEWPGTLVVGWYKNDGYWVFVD